LQAHVMHKLNAANTFMQKIKRLKKKKRWIDSYCVVQPGLDSITIQPKLASNPWQHTCPGSRAQGLQT
ncbi:hypothetical protein ACQP3J_28285, partial [Escherichia coli]